MARVVERNARADGWREKLKVQLERVLASQVAGVVRAARRGQRPKQWMKADRRKWEAELTKVKLNPTLDMAVEGYGLGVAELGNRARGKDEMMLVSLRGKAVAISATDARLRQTRMRADVEKYVRETSKIETAETARRMGNYHKLAIDTGMTSADMAKLLQAKGLAMSKTRAELMARTTTTWAYNKGAMESYRDEGVAVVEWIATVDNLTDPVCAAADGEQRKIGEMFSTGTTQPPVHPNCRCAVAPVVA